MKVYLDCEFDGLNGELISMALVSEDGREFYEVMTGEAKTLWVQENVLPSLNKLPIAGYNFCRRLWDFLKMFPGCEIIADWPADFEHLCNLMSRIGAENDFTIPIECTMTLLRGSPDIKPEIPHNALSDARALMKWHQLDLACQAVLTAVRFEPQNWEYIKNNLCDRGLESLVDQAILKLRDDGKIKDKAPREATYALWGS